LELLASVRALRAENARLEARLERLETEGRLAPLSKPATDTAKETARNETARNESVRSDGTVDSIRRGAQLNPQVTEVPALTVVKLKPRKEMTPRLPTAVDVVEPGSEVVLELSSSDKRSADKVGSDDTATQVLVEQQFEAGLAALKTGNPEGGIAQLTQFAREWPKHPKADNALFYAAVGLMAGREFKEAEALLEQAVTQYPAGDATLDAMVKLAECRARLNRQAEAKATWERIVANYPGTQAATLAQSRLAAPSNALRKE
jgi:TolA-binding protein